LWSQKDRFQRFAWGVPPIKRAITLFAAHHPFDEGHRQGRVHFRTASCSQQCRSVIRKELVLSDISRPSSVFGEFVFRHRHTGLHCGSDKEKRHGRKAFP